MAPLGENVDLFEEELSKKVSVNHSPTLVFVTADIYLARKCIRVGKDDVVLCQTKKLSARQIK